MPNSDNTKGENAVSFRNWKSFGKTQDWDIPSSALCLFFFQLSASLQNDRRTISVQIDRPNASLLHHSVITVYYDSCIYVCVERLCVTRACMMFISYSEVMWLSIQLLLLCETVIIAKAKHFSRYYNMWSLIIPHRATSSCFFLIFFIFSIFISQSDEERLIVY